jgi:hypothetical protein
MEIKERIYIGILRAAETVAAVRAVVRVFREDSFFRRKTGARPKSTVSVREEVEIALRRKRNRDLGSPDQRYEDSAKEGGRQADYRGGNG